MKKAGRDKRFITRILNNIEKRSKIMLSKGSDVVYAKKDKEGNVSYRLDMKRYGKTWSKSVLPSYKSMYVESMLQMSSMSLHEAKAVLKGMNMRPRLKMTLGNTLMVKEMKRITKSLLVKDRERRGRQVQMQYVRLIWDVRNREIRGSFKKYRSSEDRPGRTEKSEKESVEGYRKALETYETIRSCEVYRNGYELRSLIVQIDIGERLTTWQHEGKYIIPGGNRVGIVERDELVSVGLMESDNKSRLMRYGEIRRGFYQDFVEKFEKMKTLLIRERERRNAGDVVMLYEKCDKSLKTPRVQLEVKTLDRTFKDKKLERMLQRIPEREEEMKEFQEDDKTAQLQMEVPTTQYFSKRKNVRRMAERRSDLSSEEANKIRKRPEADRMEVYPQWSELDEWGLKLMEKVEKHNLERVRKGHEVDISYAKYRELGRRVWFMYRMTRGKRYDDEE